MSVAVTLQQILTVAETIGQNTNSAAAADRLVTHRATNQSNSLTASTTPAVTEVAAFRATLSAGALTIDLTALTSTNGRTLNASTGSLKLKQMLLVNPGSNAITITKGASNGYQASSYPFPDDGYKVPPKAGDTPSAVLFNFGDSCPAVSGSVKTFDLAGSGTDYLDVVMVFGP